MSYNWIHQADKQDPINVRQSLMMIKALNKYISEGAGVNDINQNRSSKTALNFAAQSGYEKVISFLLSKGAKIIDSDRGQTSLDLANGKGFNNIILKSYGTDTRLKANTNK